jgi:Ca-activated chloride channel homolog
MSGIRRWTWRGAWRREGSFRKGSNSTVAAVVVLVGLAGGAADDVHAAADGSSAAQVHVPNRPSKSLFQGEQGPQRMSIHFDPRTRRVTLELSVQDALGFFIPNIRRENFAVYENGVRQQNVTVEVEHAAVTFGLLIESGGHYARLNETLERAASAAAYQFLDEVGQGDRVAIWAYADNLQPLSEFSQDSAVLRHALGNLRPAPVSEANLYDALISALDQVRAQSGRKALILISSGIDTFSKATFEDALQAARTSLVPIYAINDAAEARSGILPSDTTYSRLDWQRAAERLQKIAVASGGRLYSPELTLDLGAIYDDLLENIRVRYVISYQSSLDADVNLPRTVKVELVDSRTGGPLKVSDANGRIVPVKVIAEEKYIPAAAPAD